MPQQLFNRTEYTEKRRELRKQPTAPEQRLWQVLRGSQLGAVADAAAKSAKSAPAGVSNSGGAQKTKPADPMEDFLQKAEATMNAKRQLRGR